MTNLFNGLNLSDEVSIETYKTGFTLRVHGRSIVTKGDFSMDVNWWGDVYTHIPKNSTQEYLFIDDYDFANNEYYLGNIKIDSINQLHNTLRNSGLSSMADLLDIKGVDVAPLIINQIKNMPIVKQNYGDTKFYQYDLTQEERDVIEGKDNNKDYKASY
jgi:hypothetical protein